MKAGSKEYFMAILSMVLGILIISMVTDAKVVGFGKGHLTFTADWVVWLAFGLGFLGLTLPQYVIYLLNGVQFIQHKIGRVITTIILSVIFYAILTPIAFLANARKKKAKEKTSALIDRNFTYDKKSFENTF